jgi:hypothetical protein
MPASCPSDNGNPLISAHLLLPSIITATCFGISSFLSFVGGIIKSSPKEVPPSTSSPSAFFGILFATAAIVSHLVTILEGNWCDWEFLEREEGASLVVIFGGEVIRLFFSTVGNLNENMIFLFNLSRANFKNEMLWLLREVGLLLFINRLEENNNHR